MASAYPLEDNSNIDSSHTGLHRGEWPFRERLELPRWSRGATQQEKAALIAARKAEREVKAISTSKEGNVLGHRGPT